MNKSALLGMHTFANIDVTVTINYNIEDGLIVVNWRSITCVYNSSHLN